jgi:mono/diheme cytochrome c family protein
MRLSTKRVKLTLIATASALLFALTFMVQPATHAYVPADDAAATYTAKCKMCHGATAEKHFDASKADADLVKIVLEGATAKDGKKMPAFKSYSEDAAKGLVAYMKSIKK